MTSCLFRKDIPRPRSLSARCWDVQGRNTHRRPATGSPPLEHTLCHTPHIPDSPPLTRVHSTHRALQIRPTPHIHNPSLTRTHTNTCLPQHPPITQTHSNTCHHHSTCIHTTRPQMQIPRGMCRCPRSLAASAQTAAYHIYSDWGRAIAMGWGGDGEATGA